MDYEMISNLLQPFVLDAAVAADQAERMRARLEDHASVVPEDFLQQLEALVESLRDLRDDIYDAGLDPDDDAASPRRDRPDIERPPARL